jgi:high-affinity iron transporter
MPYLTHVHWADAVPNLLIGLREGLEAGLVVSILLAALRKAPTPDGGRASSAPIWLGVLGAVAMAGSFAAVLTYSTSVLSSRAQEAVGGVLSVLAVGLVTAMIFWMRSAAAALSAELAGRVRNAVLIGAGALTMTAFLAVGREGLETTLFLWAAVRASGQTASPLIGAGLGLVAAIVLCVLLFRRAIRLNLGVFFARTAVGLIVIAAGVLAYGLGELQDAGWLSGQGWVAFDLTSHINPTSWWVSIITGVTELAPRMTVLQVVAWAAYLVVVVGVFVGAGRAVASEAAAGAGVRTDRARGLRAGVAASGRHWDRLTGRRPWAVAGVLVVVPVVAASGAILALPSTAAGAATSLTVTRTQCGSEWSSGHTGTQTFTVSNTSAHAGEINLDDSSGGVVAEIETLGPGTKATMSATLGAGTYSFVCRMSGLPTTKSAAVRITGVSRGAPAAVRPVSLNDLASPNNAYQQYAAQKLAGLLSAVAVLRRDLRHGDLQSARAAWLVAQLAWERVGASYDSFGPRGIAIDGLPDGLPQGVHDPSFTGLHRIEYGLWHHQGSAALLPVADGLVADITDLRTHLRSDDVTGDPTNLPLRAHEILEDALRDHLSGIDDEGAGAGYAETYADLQVTRVVLSELRELIASRASDLMPTLDREIRDLGQALLASRTGARWPTPATITLSQRQGIDAAIGALLESLSRVPDLLEVPPSA